MNKKYIMTFLLVLSTVFAVEVRDREVIVLENRLNTQLQNYLSTIIPANSFAVSATLRASERTIKEYLNASEPETPRVFPGTIPNDDGIGPLPGLEESPGGGQLAPTISEANSGPYTLVKRLEIDTVDVQITVDNDVPAATQAAIRRAIGSKLDALYDGVANFSLLPADIKSDLDLDDAEAVVNPVTDFNPTGVTPEEEVIVEGPLDKYSILFYSFLFLVGMTLLALLLFLLLILTFRFLNRREQRLRYESTHGIPNARSSFDAPRTIYEDGEKNLASSPPPFSEPTPPPIAPIPPVAPIPRPVEPVVARQEDTTERNNRVDTPLDSSEDDNDARSTVATLTKPKPSIIVRPETLVKAEIEFVENFLREPLSSRKFFLEMGENAKLELVKSFSSESFKKHFFKLDPSLPGLLARTDVEEELGVTGEDGEKREYYAKPELTAGEKVENLRSAVLSLAQYRRLIAYQIKDPIGKLSLLTPQETVLVLSSLSAPVLVSLAPFIDSKIMEGYVRSISEQKKRDLLGAMSVESSSEDTSIEKIRLNAMKEKLNLKIDELARNLFVERTKNENVIENIFKASSNTKELLEELRGKDAALYEKFEKYGIAFADMLLESESAEFARLVDDSNNEILSTVMLGMTEEDRSKILKPLPDARREVVEAMMFSKQGTVAKDAIDNAREAFLESYRSLKT